MSDTSSCQVFVLDAGTPGWPDAIEACRSGDMITCDFVFEFSEIGSAEERVGETCGERRAVVSADPCQDQFGQPAG